MFATVKKKATKVGSTATVVRNSVLIISHITFGDCRVHIFQTTFLEIAVYYGFVFKGVLVLVIMKTKKGLCFRNYEN